jgi:hypothetical protein
MMSNVHLAYVDETGDTGPLSKKGASACYGLGCVLIDINDWASTYDGLVGFRRVLRDQLGVNVRWEIKANYLIRNGGPLRKLGLTPQQRRWIYREHLRLLHPLGAEAFAIVVDKEKADVSGDACFHMAWESLIQRLERTMNARKSSIMIIHDEGENDAIRKEARRARRFLTAGSRYGGGYMKMSFPQLIDDPVPRNSQNSYLLQMADLVAYSGWRAYMPPSKGVALVAPRTMWNETGSARLTVVNSGRMPAAVVVRTY